jgi:alpha-L-fucosidase
LLNVGPDGNGIVPEESAKILLDVGKKIKEN